MSGIGCQKTRCRVPGVRFQQGLRNTETWTLKPILLDRIYMIFRIRLVLLLPKILLILLILSKKKV